MAKDLRKALAEIKSYDDFFEVRRNIESYLEVSLFQTLWPLAIQNRGDSSSGMAGYMLAELQPNTELDLAVLLAHIHASELDASNRIVPFYLISQFGKHAVQVAANEFISTLPNETPRSRVQAVLYWSSCSASELCKRFHDWEAREMYCADDDEA